MADSVSQEGPRHMTSSFLKNKGYDNGLQNHPFSVSSILLGVKFQIANGQNIGQVEIFLAREQRR